MKVIRAIQLLLSKRNKDERGMSLIELMISVLFIGLIAGLVSVIFVSAGNASKDVIDITKSEIDSRLSIYRISRDIREANSVMIAGNDQIKLLGNVDPDDNYEEINYYIESKNGHYVLIRSVDGGNEITIATHLITDNIFTYYSDISIPEDGMATPVSSDNIGNIKLVRIAISIDQSGAQSLRTMDLDTLITLRNRT